MIEFFAVIKPPDHLIVPKSRFPDYRHVRLSAKILRLQDIVCISDDFAQESESRLKMGMFFPDEFAVLKKNLTVILPCFCCDLAELDDDFT